MECDLNLLMPREIETLSLYLFDLCPKDHKFIFWQLFVRFNESLVVKDNAEKHKRDGWLALKN